MIYILFIGHTIQHNRNLAMHKVFTDYLQNIYLEFNISIFAEEFSTEALIISNVKTSVLQDVAQNIGIKHIFCDPTSEQRKIIGWNKDKDYLREQYWLGQLTSHVYKNVLFLCGNKHKSTLTKLLTQKSIAYVVLEKTFIPDVDKIAS